MPKPNLYKNQDFGPEAKTLSQENKEEESQIFSEVTWVIKKTETFFLKKVRNKMLSFQPRLELFVTLELGSNGKIMSSFNMLLMWQFFQRNKCICDSDDLT